MSALSIAPYFPFPRVIPVRQRLTRDVAGEMYSEITFEAPRRPVCSGCGQPRRAIHSTIVRAVRDPPLAGVPVVLTLPLRKVRCPRCGVRTEQHEFLATYRRATVRFERAVAELCRVLPIKRLGWLLRNGTRHVSITQHDRRADA